MESQYDNSVSQDGAKKPIISPTPLIKRITGKVRSINNKLYFLLFLVGVKR